MTVDDTWCHHHRRSDVTSVMIYPLPMARSRPDALGRLQQAALEKLADRGFDDTTVTDIAGRAGLTKRTFFRYFTDKREVLFSGAAELERLFVTAVRPPESAAPIDAVVAALRRRRHHVRGASSLRRPT